MSEQLEHKIIPISEIFADEEFNCRGVIKPIEVVDLAKDIERQGLIQPITVSPFAEGDKIPAGKKYRLLAGFRRYKAHIVLNRTEIPAMVKVVPLKEADARIFNLAENLHRVNLNVLQEAKAMRRLFMFYNESEIAVKLGQSRGWVQIRAMLLKLPEDIQKEVEAGMIGHVNIRELYAIHRSGNTKALHEAVRKIKDAKIRGTRTTVNPNIVGDKAKTKRYRLRAEIERMTIALVEHGVKGLHTRALAWAAGNITMGEFMDDIAKYAADNDIAFTPISEEELDKICAL